jgi:hypothetical protein
MYKIKLKFMPFGKRRKSMKQSIRLLTLLLALLLCASCLVACGKSKYTVDDVEVTVSDTETQEDTTPATEKPTEGDTLQETDPPQKGCGSALVGVSTLAVTAAAALTLRKRKED